MTSMSRSVQTWLDFTTALGEIGLQVHRQAEADRSPEQLAEINRALMIILSSSTLFQLGFDPDCPDWLPRLNSSVYVMGGQPGQHLLHDSCRRPGHLPDQGLSGHQ